MSADPKNLTESLAGVACPCGSGKPFSACHGVGSPIAAPPVPLSMARPDVTLKLDLACGQTPQEGFDGVDLFAENAKHRFNLLRYPWPVEDESVLEIHCSHFVEHIPMEYVDKTGASCKQWEGIDAMERFFEEVHRVLVPDGFATIVVPSARSSRAFWDPTHRRFLVAESFLYLNQEWLAMQKLQHYHGKANFGVSCTPTVPSEMLLLNNEVAQRRIAKEWDATLDWVARLKKLPGVTGGGPL